MPQQARYGASHYLSQPEAREAQRRGGKKGGARSSRRGVPDGWRREEIELARKFAREEAERIVDYMERTGKVSFEDEASKTALLYCVEVIRAGDKAEATKDRLKACDLVLQYTKIKPAQRVEARVTQAEEFLDNLARESDA